LRGQDDGEDEETMPRTTGSLQPLARHALSDEADAWTSSRFDDWDSNSVKTAQRRFLLRMLGEMPNLCPAAKPRKPGSEVPLRLRIRFCGCTRVGACPTRARSGMESPIAGRDGSPGGVAGPRSRSRGRPLVPREILGDNVLSFRGNEA
jgi:hypothetical protein